MRLRPIPRIKRPDPHDFVRDYVRQGKPVVVTDAVDAWPAFERWKDIGYLQAAAKDRKIALVKLDTSASYRQEVALADYLEGMKEPSTDLQVDYISDTRVAEVFPELLGDIGTMPYHRVPTADLVINAGRRTYAAMHFHAVNEAISLQVVGQKRFLLFGPEQSKKVDPQPWHSPLFNLGRMDLSRGEPSEAHKKAFETLEGWEATLEPGSFIYIPIHWWHVVYGAPEFNVLLVALFSSPIRQWHFPYPAIPSLLQQTARRVMPEWLRSALEDRLVPKRPA